MNERKSNKPKKNSNLLSILLFMGIGAVCGFLIIAYLDSAAEMNKPEYLLMLLASFILIYLVVFIQIIIHEAGHLFFGLKTGYSFSSFRVGNFMWVREEGKLKLRRLSLIGTGGQCLMVPPEMEDGKFPIVLYNLGGSIFNAISATIFIGGYFLFRNIYFLSLFFLVMSIVGIAYALMNAIPMRLGAVDNDGQNARSLGRNLEALRAFWVQLKVNEAVAKGTRLKDMPEEWFELPREDAMSNSITATIAVFATNRLMDMHEFSKAAALIDSLLETDTAMTGLHRSLMICDRIFCELLRKTDNALIEKLKSKDQIKFMKQMKNFPSVIRTEYACSLLSEGDAVKANQAKAQFDKCARTYPYKSDIESERELMAIAGKESTDE